MLRALILFVMALAFAGCAHEARSGKVVLWHSYRGKEKEALETLVQEWSEREGVAVELLAVPHDGFSAKLEAAIPFGDGPDVFIDAHERLGSFIERKLVVPAGDGYESGAFEPLCAEAVTVGGEVYGVPLAAKSLALYYRTDLVARAPETLEGLRDALAGPLPSGAFLLAYESRVIYAHAPFLHAFGGRLLTAQERFGFVGEEAERSLELVRGLADRGDVPEAADGGLVTRLFAGGQAAFAISGPWLASDLDEQAEKVPFEVAVLPRLAATGEPLRPLLTVDALMFSPDGGKRAEARALGRFLGSREASLLRQRVARAVSPRTDVPVPDGDRFVRAFSDQAKLAVPMPSSVAMRAVWEPAEKALRSALAGGDAHAALIEAERRFDDVRRPLPPRTSPAPLMLVAGAFMLVGAWQLVRRARDPRFRERLRASLPAYAYVTHALIALGVLVFLPLLAGAGISLLAGPPSDQYYVGFANFREILTARGGPLFASGSFYLVLAVTVLWTVTNLAFHLGIGMFLGVLLSRASMRLRGLYRVLLIIPWAVPNYVTALAWKGMFHQQFGAVTALTRALAGGLGVELQPIAWFSRFSTAFAANAATNIWLGFPFMMVVTLAALTAVPSDVLEAAEVDGASRWQRFWLVTLPVVRPSMVPAALLGAVWTFNMFNVVFLVSGGDPDGQTDILVSEAYRWAFTRQAQYGYAAAYAVLIFLLLFGITRLGERASRLRAARSEVLEA